MGCQSSSPINVPQLLQNQNHPRKGVREKGDPKELQDRTQEAKQTLQTLELSLCRSSAGAASLSSHSSNYNESYCDSFSTYTEDSTMDQDSGFESVLEINIKEIRYFSKSDKIERISASPFIDNLARKNFGSNFKNRRKLKKVDVFAGLGKQHLSYHNDESLYTKFAKTKKMSLA